MNVLVIGQGGREHAIAWKLAQSEKVETVFIAPGNGGTEVEDKCKNISINISDFPAIKNLIKERNIKLVVIGPEDPLVNGLVDFLQNEDIHVFGPSANGAKLEGSKIYSKEFMFNNKIPTGDANFFSCSVEAKNYLEHCQYPIVLKADGLAAGKGVLVAEDSESAKSWVDAVMNDSVFGNAGKNILVEECLFGTELSFMGILTPKEFIPFETSVDYKPLEDCNTGPNTGGMGCISPSPFMNEQLKSTVMQKVVKPTLDGLNKLGIQYYGFMYFGLMVKDNDPKVLEFNCRLGDPETQCLMMQMESDLVDCLTNALNDKKVSIEWKSGSSMGVVIASDGYPGSYETGKTISLGNTENLKVFHAGTKLIEGSLQTSGGRVFSVNYHDKSLELCSEYIYKNIEEVQFDGNIYRKDIGKIYES
jgi:phosphoribosylamine--glycine ligase